MLLLVTLVGCSQSSGAASSSPSAAAGCRLAVQQSDVKGNNTIGGFLTVPGGTTVEPAAGAAGANYNPALGRWVTSAWGVWSADGLTSTHIDGDTTTSRVHLVDLRTGADRVLATGGPWSVVAFEAEGIYLMKLVYGPPSAAFGTLATPQGLWLLPLNGGAPQQITADHRSWQAVHGGLAWANELNRADPQPYGGDVGYSPNQIVRMDLATRTTETWLYTPGESASVMGVDRAGVPFVESQNGGKQEVWRLDRAKPEAPIWAAKWGELGPSMPMVADGSVVWMSGWLPSPPYSPAVYRWSAASGLQLVARFDDRRVWVAGPCI